MNSYIHVIFWYMNSYVSWIHIWIRVYQGPRWGLRVLNHDLNRTFDYFCFKLECSGTAARVQDLPTCAGLAHGHVGQWSWLQQLYSVASGANWPQKPWSSHFLQVVGIGKKYRKKQHGRDKASLQTFLRLITQSRWHRGSGSRGWPHWQVRTQSSRSLMAQRPFHPEAWAPAFKAFKLNVQGLRDGHCALATARAL